MSTTKEDNIIDVPESQVVRCQDEDGWRVYTVNGQPRYSVTEVLDFFVDKKLKNWFVKTSPKEIEKKKTETAQKGSDIHEQAKDGNETRLNILLARMEMEPLANEFMVHSKHGWAGTVDLTVSYKGKKYLLDIKTGRFGHVALQLSAYTLAYNEHGGNIEGNGVISLPRDPSLPASFFEYSEHMEQSQYAWACAFDVWKHHYFKKLIDHPWFETKTALSYQWSF